MIVSGDCLFNFNTLLCGDFLEVGEIMINPISCCSLAMSKIFSSPCHTYPPPIKIPIVEYAPKKIKLAITGRGQASKEQVAGMLTNMLSINQRPKYLDATDGLAAAVCHALQKNYLVKDGKKSWNQFIKENPERINN